MKVVVFSTHSFDREFLGARLQDSGHEARWIEARLDVETAKLIDGEEAVCLFANDQADGSALRILAERGVRLLALRSAGFNHVDLATADRLGLTVARVPAYSPEGIAEHAMALLLALNRRIPRATARTREGNFELQGLMGFNLSGKTVGIVGTGKIGICLVRIARGFGCHVLACDPVPSEAARAAGAKFVELEELLAASDIVSLHCPLAPNTRHLIDTKALERMKRGAYLINTSRGGLVDTKALIQALKEERLGAVGLDVYEEEGDVFFKDLSDRPLNDDVLARILTFPNVLVTGHQAFFTREAVGAIAETTVINLDAFARGGREAVPSENLVQLEEHFRSGG